MEEQEVIRYGRFSKLGDELVVWSGYSDWGEWGWFVGTRYIDDRDPDKTRISLQPKVWYGEKNKAEAEKAAEAMKKDTSELWGFPFASHDEARRSNTEKV